MVGRGKEALERGGGVLRVGVEGLGECCRSHTDTAVELSGEDWGGKGRGALGEGRGGSRIWATEPRDGHGW